jgi:phosphoenolpyruvate carboxykinase (GTP)
MLPGQTIVGDDIAYIRMDNQGYPRAVNIESGVFGIIRDVNPKDDPLIYKALTTPRELIFSNVLSSDGRPYWLGMGIEENEYPPTGINHSGKWWKGKKDEEGNEIPLAHPNARYTIRIKELENVDPHIDDPEGIVINGIFYGGRDSDTNVPIIESLNWEHGVYMGATIESETTSATLGKQGIRKHNPMAMMDFMVVPLGLYIKNHIKFGKKLKMTPRIFATNYFLKNEGEYVNDIMDKLVWVIWAEGRVNKEYKAIRTPIGYIPYYNDLKKLFRILLKKEYYEEHYIVEFSIRLDKYLEKIIRMEKIYRKETETPKEFWQTHNQIKKEVTKLKEKTRESTLPPDYFLKAE